MALLQTPGDNPNPAAIVLGLLASAILWAIFIPRGLKAARDSGRSPHWMWFGIHPFGAVIACLVLRHLAKSRVFHTRIAVETAILEAASKAGGRLTLAGAAKAAHAPIEQVQLVMDKFIKFGVADTDITNEGMFIYRFHGLPEESDGKRQVIATREESIKIEYRLGSVNDLPNQDYSCSAPFTLCNHHWTVPPEGVACHICGIVERVPLRCEKCRTVVCHQCLGKL